MNETGIPSESLNRRVKCEECETTLYAGAEKCTECDSTDIDSDWNSLQSAYQKHDVGEAYFVGRVNEMGLEAEHWGIDMRHDDGGLIFDNKMDLRLWTPLDGQGEPPDADDEFRGVWWHENALDETVSESFCAKTEADPSWLAEDRWRLDALVDVKTKANPDWLGVCNIRHLAHYAEHAAAYHSPTFIYFTMVDMDTETVGSENIFVPVPTDWPYQTVAKHFENDSGTSLPWGELKDLTRECRIVDRVFRAPDGNPVVMTDDDHYGDFEDFRSEILSESLGDAE